MNLSARFIASLVGCVVAAAPAMACQYEGAPEPVGYPSATFLAEGLYGAASFVDLVVAERARPLRAPDGQVRTQAITFRVIQRWKGRSPDRFTLWGQGLHPEGMGSGWLRNHWVDELGRVTPHPTPAEMPAVSPTTRSSCDPGFLRATVGRTYVVFREADGRLLGPVVHHSGSPPARGLEFVEVGSPREDEWFNATFLRSFGNLNPRRPTPPVPAKEAAPDRALLVFRRPLTAEATTALLQRAGVRPYAVHVVAGDFIDEHRVAAEWAGPGVIAEAVGAARDNLASEGHRGVARTILTGLTVEELENDGWKRGYAAALVLAEERLARARRAQLLVGSVEVLGPPAAIMALRRDPRVSMVEEGFTMRGRAAAPPPPGRGALAVGTFGEQARALSPAFLMHRLRVMAGELDEGATEPARAAAVVPPPPHLRDCIRVASEEARGFTGLVQLGAVGAMRVWGEPEKMKCRDDAAYGRGECTVSGPSRVRLEFASGVSGFNIPRNGPVVVSYSASSFNCRAAGQ